MKRAPFTVAAALCLAVFLCPGIGQADLTQADCSDCICITDATCSDDGCTTFLTSNCSRREFTPACTGIYDLYAAVVSCGDVCGKCFSCVNIFQLDGTTETFLANCHTHVCASDICETSCTVELNASTIYVLYVCKLYCPGYANDCEDCDESCEAIGCISYGHTNLPCTP